MAKPPVPKGYISGTYDIVGYMKPKKKKATAAKKKKVVRKKK